MNDEQLQRLERLERLVHLHEGMLDATSTMLTVLFGQQPQLAQWVLNFLPELRDRDLYVNLPDEVLNASRQMIQRIAEGALKRPPPSP